MDTQEIREAIVEEFVRQTKCTLSAAEIFDDEVKKILGIENDEPPQYLIEALYFTDLFNEDALSDSLAPIQYPS